MRHPFPKDFNQSIKWARKIIDNSSKWIILDTETTGIGKDDVVIQLAIAELGGKSIINTYIKPFKQIVISKEAVAFHGITYNKLNDAPYYKDIYGDIQRELGNKGIIAYNADFDKRLLKQTALKESAPIIKAPWHCAMIQYARYVGQWNEERKSYKYQKLIGGNHTAMGDCLATIELIKMMSKASLID